MKAIRWLAVILLVFALILVRKFETDLFFDPVLSYFHGDFSKTQFPEFSIYEHSLSMSLRYLINTLISLSILYLIFLNQKLIKLAAVLYIVFFIVILPSYIYFLNTEFSHATTAGFYVRRFLIQPVFLLILIPAFWYYLRTK